MLHGGVVSIEGAVPVPPGSGSRAPPSLFPSTPCASAGRWPPSTPKPEEGPPLEEAAIFEISVLPPDGEASAKEETEEASGKETGLVREAAT